MIERVERVERVVDGVVGEVERGSISRREAVRRLVAVVGAAAAGGFPAMAREAGPTFRSVGLNHVALRVTDLARSREFYGAHLGLSVLQQSRHNCFLAAGGNNFVALFRHDRPGLDHFAFTVDGYDAGAAVERLREAGLAPRRAQDRVYFDDPDGIELQLTGEWDDYPAAPPSSSSSSPSSSPSSDAG